MAIHFGIIADFLNSKNDPAFFDVVPSSASSAARYTVYQPGTGDLVVVVPYTNQLIPFATSPDLFNIGGSAVALPALVSAETVDGANNPDGATSAAIIRQKKAILFTTLNNNLGQATSFLFPLGDLGSTTGGKTGANVLVAHPNSGPIGISVTVNGATQPQVTLDRGGCVAIPLNTAPAIVSVRTTLNAIVALAVVGKGQDFAMTLIEPTS